MRAREIAVILHRYMGLATAAFLAVAGLTGAIIAFNHELDELLNPSLFERRSAGPALPAVELVARIEAANPDLYVSFIEIEPAPRTNLAVSVRPRPDPVTGAAAALGFDQIFVDPASGEILGAREWGALRLDAAHLLPFIYKLHYSLHVPGVAGILLMGIVAIIWTIDCFIGAWLTLPRAGPFWRNRFWRKWAPAWRIKRKAATHRRVLDIHRAGGLWLWGLLLMMAVSGVALNLPDHVFRPLVGLVADLSPSMRDLAAERAGLDRRGPPALGFEEALARATHAAPGLGITEPPSLLWHPRSFGTIAVGFGDHHGTGLGNAWLFFDDQTGAFLHAEIPGTGTPADTFVQAQYPLHSGQIIGLPGRILVALLGLAVCVLSVTGVVIWWRKRAARRAVRPDRLRPGGAQPARTGAAR